MRYQTTLPEDTLRDMYLDKRYSMRQISEIFKVSPPTVAKELRRYGIEVKKSNKGLIAITAAEHKGLINCATQGEKCKYRYRVKNDLQGTCNYLEIAGRMRGCDASACDKYAE